MFNTILENIIDFWKKIQIQNKTQDNSSYTMGVNNFDNTMIYSDNKNSESNSESLDNSCISDNGSRNDSCDSSSDSGGSSD